MIVLKQKERDTKDTKVINEHAIEVEQNFQNNSGEENEQKQDDHSTNVIETETTTYYKQLMHIIENVNEEIREEIEDSSDTDKKLVLQLIALLQQVKEIKNEATHHISEADMIPLHIQVEGIRKEYMNLCYTLLDTPNFRERDAASSCNHMKPKKRKKKGGKHCKSAKKKNF